MKLELNIQNTENIEDLSQSDIRDIEEIVTAAVEKGAFTRVRGGKTIIHFDGQGVFQKIETSYGVWTRRSL